MNVRRQLSTLSAAVLTTFALVAIAEPSVATTQTGSITGIAKLHGKEISGIRARLMQSVSEGDSYTQLTSAVTDSDGSYSFSKVPLGLDGLTYEVVFTDSAHRVLVEKRLVLPKPNKTVSRDVTLRPAATISGTLAREDGATTHEVSVLLDGDPVPSDTGLDRYDDATRVHVHTHGAFELVGVPAGTHFLQFSDDSGKYLDQCYDNVPAKYTDHSYADCYSDVTPEATTFTVGSGQDVTLNPQTMSHPAARVSGTVTDTSGNPIKEIRVQLTPSDNTFGPRYGLTNASGEFTVGGLPAGRWLMSTSDPNARWAGEWYDNAVKSEAKVLDLAEGQATGDLTVDLKARAVVSAKVTPGSGSASFGVSVIRKTNGGPAYGTLTVSYGSQTKSATLTKGEATIRLTGIPSGSRSFTVSYAGTASTSAATKTYTAKIK
jgi:hypothetical protein